VDLDLAAEDKVPVEDRIYPFYEYKADNGSNLYILAIRGSGLWDKIWGYVAIDKEGTIQGVSFDHKGETPGLGAEIKDSDRFKEQFKGKKIFDVQKQLVSVTVQKRSIKKPDHQVMGISGATITSDGVTEMLQRGIKVYENHLAELRK
jgi:Na+-transporting NADH:ubiquinone oxidoreductase subunit C